MIKVASYCRVSTDKYDQANSFETQQRYFREYIAHQPDWELFDIYADEGLSGTNTRRRIQFNRMINDAYDGKFSLIITKEVSRFSRNILDTISYTRDLKSIGVGVLFLTDRINTLEPESEMLLSFLASLAQEESRRTSSRVVWGQTRQMERGVVFGQSMLGYDVQNGMLTVNPEGAAIVRLIFQKYALEQISSTEIARFLTKEGYCTYRGSTTWKSNTVIKILHNEKYAGDLIQKKSYTPDFLTHEKRKNKDAVPMIRITDHHEPIISREVWNLAQDRLRKNNKHGEGKGGHSNRYVFSGRIKCGECGSSFVGRCRYLKDGTRVRRWSCGTALRDSAAACNVGKLIRDDDAMQMLKLSIRSLQFDTEAIIRNATTLALDAIQSGAQGITDDSIRLRYELDRIQRKKEAMMDSYFSQEITKEDMLAMKQRYEHQANTLQERSRRLEEAQKNGTDTDSLRTSIQEEITAILNGKKDSEVFSKTILYSLTVYKDRHMELRLNHLPHVFHFLG